MASYLLPISLCSDKLYGMLKMMMIWDWCIRILFKEKNKKAGLSTI